MTRWSSNAPLACNMASSRSPTVSQQLPPCCTHIMQQQHVPLHRSWCCKAHLRGSCILNATSLGRAMLAIKKGSRAAYVGDASAALAYVQFAHSSFLTCAANGTCPTDFKNPLQGQTIHAPDAACDFNITLMVRNAVETSSPYTGSQLSTPAVCPHNAGTCLV